MTIIDGSSGERHEFVVGGDASANKGGRPRPAAMAGVDPRLLEKSRYGIIPVVADGLKPFTLYAAEADRAKAAKDAGDRDRGRGPRRRRRQDRRRHHEVPPAMTLAFTPYGADPPSSPNGRGRSATKSCCRCRWSHSTIPTTIPARRTCSRRSAPSKISTA